MISIRVYLLLTILLALSFHLSAEMEMGTNTTADYLMREVSGTAFGPASAPQHMSMKKSGDWSLMFHGLVDINQIVQSGPRGKDRFFSTNWFMGTASRPLGNGTLMFRSMMSLDPLTVTDRQYPLLFQTGETAFGKPLIDAQHPHDLFMELSMQYAIEISHDTIFRIYFAPVGDPALGPVAFPHRISASEFPQATLSHHLQDSSHIVNEVITGGIHHGIFDFEGSAFHGAEPDERRWNIDHGAIDSWAARLQLQPSANWSAQVSTGKLKHPEELEPGNIQRTTASLTYNRPMSQGNWASSFIWGSNHRDLEDRNLDSFVVESIYLFNAKNYLSGRFEVVDKDELFPDDNEVFRISAFTLGYTRNFHWISGLQTGIGANVTVYNLPSELKTLYGANPVGAVFYLRLRIGAHGAMKDMHHHH